MAPISPAAHVPLLVHNRSRYAFRITFPSENTASSRNLKAVTVASAKDESHLLHGASKYATLVNVPLGKVLRNKTVSLHLVKHHQGTSDVLNTQAEPHAPIAFSIKINPTAQSPHLVLSTTTVHTNASAQDRWQEVKVESESSVWALQSAPTGSTPASLMLFSTRPPESFLSTLPDSLLLSGICLPGTHESLSRYGWPVSTCQEETSTVAAQLAAGIRYFDVRLVPKGVGNDMRLLAYHGISDQRIEFGAVLQQVYAWLDGAGKRDTIIMSLKQEGGPAPPVFDNLLASTYVQPNASRWFLEPRVPTLGEARGKIVMFSRFGTSTSQPGGIHPTVWPDSSPTCFTFTTPSSQLVEIEDWYNIGVTSNANLANKISIIQQLLLDVGSDASKLGIAYANGTSFPGALPPTVAKGTWGVAGMNERLLSIVATRLQLPIPSSTTVSDDSAIATDVTETAVESGPDSHKWNPFAILKAKSPPPTTGSAPVAPVYDPPARKAGLSVTFPLDYFASTPQLVPLLIEANFAPGT